MFLVSISNKSDPKEDPIQSWSPASQIKNGEQINWKEGGRLSSDIVWQTGEAYHVHKGSGQFWGRVVAGDSWADAAPGGDECPTPLFMLIIFCLPSIMLRLGVLPVMKTLNHEVYSEEKKKRARKKKKQCWCHYHIIKAWSIMNEMRIKWGEAEVYENVLCEEIKLQLILLRFLM